MASRGGGKRDYLLGDFPTVSRLSTADRRRILTRTTYPELEELVAGDLSGLGSWRRVSRAPRNEWSSAAGLMADVRPSSGHPLNRDRIAVSSRSGIQLQQYREASEGLFQSGTKFIAIPLICSPSSASLRRPLSARRPAATRAINECGKLPLFGHSPVPPGFDLRGCRADDPPP